MVNVLNGKGLKAEFDEKGKLIVKSKFWQVSHDPEKGGCITEIRFYNGSNKNILMNPISSHFGSFWDVLDDKAVINLAEEGQNIAVRITGELKDTDGHTASGIKYEYIHEYGEGHVKVTRKYSFERNVEGMPEVGIGCMDIVPELRDFAARPSHVSADDSYRTSVAKWGEVDLDDKVAFEDKNIPLYMAVFRRGVEGIEFLPSADLEEWSKQLIGEKDRGRFQIRGESNPKAIRILIEPFNSRAGAHGDVRFTGEYAFSSYMGLPKIQEKTPRKYMHMAFNKHPWPSDDEIRKWAFSGVNIVRLHNDYHPSGDFWHDGSWPPYDEKGMSELKRVIDACHRYGIKIVPYFSLYEINPKSDAFAGGYVAWRRTIDDRATLIETYPPTHYYGFGMCLKSGWKEFLKEYVKKVVKTLGFDGIYYDYSQYWFCNNKLHGKGDHTSIEDLIDFMEYTRDLVGDDGVMLLHQSGWWPSVLVENYADGHIMFEDNVEWREIPAIEEFPPNASHLTFMNVAPKIPCPIVGVPDRVEGAWDLSAKCSVLGAFPWGIGPGSRPFLELFEAFRAFDLSQFRFADYTVGYVKTSDAAIKGAVYYNQERVLVVLANVRGKRVQSFKWNLDLEGAGLEPSQRYDVTGSRGDPILQVKGQDLVKEGIEDSLDGFRFSIYSVTRCHDDEKHVLHNTRAWTENHTETKLVVETKGPMGQRSNLKFHSPAKPKEVKLGSRILKEDEEWTWDNKTKIGTVTYDYVDTKAKVIIEIH